MHAEMLNSWQIEWLPYDELIYIYIYIFFFKGCTEAQLPEIHVHGVLLDGWASA